jgi:hypothetical protein
MTALYTLKIVTIWREKSLFNIDILPGFTSKYYTTCQVKTLAYFARPLITKRKRFTALPPDQVVTATPPTAPPWPHPSSSSQLAGSCSNVTKHFRTKIYPWLNKLVCSYIVKYFQSSLVNPKDNDVPTISSQP